MRGNLYFENTTYFEKKGASFYLKPGIHYELFATSAGYLFSTEEIAVMPEDGRIELQRDLKLVKLRPGLEISLKRIQFASNRSNTLASCRDSLYRIGRFIHQQPGIVISIAPKNPSSMAMRRAEFFAIAMRLYGVPESQLRLRQYNDSLAEDAGRDSDDADDSISVTVLKVE